MPLKKFRPMTPALRHTVLPDYSEITRRSPLKSLTERRKKTGGRDNRGHISSRWIGGGHKQRYRLVDFIRNKDGIPARVASIVLAACVCSQRSTLDTASISARRVRRSRVPCSSSARRMPT